MSLFRNCASGFRFCAALLLEFPNKIANLRCLSYFHGAESLIGIFCRTRFGV